MDYLGGASATLMSASKTTASSAGFFDRMVVVAVALVVLRLEVMRRTADLPQRAGRQMKRGCLQDCQTFLRQHAPETGGLVACFALAAALRIHGSTSRVVDEKTWAAITRDWPILMTADSLLALQAMLRVVVLISAVLRVGPKPLAREGALVFCSAALARTALALRSDVYMLDGPLGGYVPVACEVASVPLFALLSRGISKQAAVPYVFTIAATACLAYRNRLSLAEDVITDGLFIFAHITELIAGFVYLFRSLLLDVGTTAVGKNGVGLRFAHLIMLVQQCCSAYYFVQAFEATPALVSSGHPFEVLQMGAIVQLAAYAGAAGLNLAEYMETPQVETNYPADE